MDEGISDMDPNELNSYLASRSYVSGYRYGYADLTLYKKVSQSADKYEKCSHVLRWLGHVKSLSSQLEACIKEDLPQKKKLLTYDNIKGKLKLLSVKKHQLLNVK